MSYYGWNRQLQDAVASYLTTNLATYAGGVASVLPIVKGGEFSDLSLSHILVYAPTVSEITPFVGRFEAQVAVRVATLEDVSNSTHLSYCKAVFDLMADLDFPDYINAISGNPIKVNQVVGGASIAIGVIQNLRHDTLTMKLSIYQGS